tara:strand:- start:32475 stop:34010 length:1536 start_codon:yes stop_codon:yes gene_type:complete
MYSFRRSDEFPRFVFAFIILLTCLNISCPVLAIPAFDGAEGFGANTSHARGTGICIVDNLEDTDKAQQAKYMVQGSFRYCLARAKESGGSYIIFAVSGTLDLKRPAFIPSNTYIAGQTSPGGIALAGEAIVLENAENIVVRHLRHREAANRGDAFTLSNAHNIVIDHVSVSFFKDGAVDIVDGSTDVTIQWSHMGDAIFSGFKDERYHGQPNLLRTNVNRISLHHNFYTHGHTRMPLVSHNVAYPGFLIEFSNNVIYNYGKYPSRFAAYEGLGNVIGNYYIPGRNTHSDSSVSPIGTKGKNALLHKSLDAGARPPILVENGMRLFLQDNFMEDGDGHDGSNFTDKYGKQIDVGQPGHVTGVRTDQSQPEGRMVATAAGKIVEKVVPFVPLEHRVAAVPQIKTDPAKQNVRSVLQSFGALPRDNTDNRLVKEFQSRWGRWKYIKPFDENRYTDGPIIDSDFDGMSDEFEKRAGRDIGPIGHDLNENLDNIEIYLDELAHALLDSNPAIALKD